LPGINDAQNSNLSAPQQRPKQFYKKKSTAYKKKKI